MSLGGNVDALATRVATEVKAVRSETHPYLGPSGGDDTSALNTFLTTYAGETAQMPRLAGTYTITGTVTIKGNLNATEATFNYTGSGTAVQVGTGGSGVRIDRCRVTLPRVSCANKPSIGWVASTVGVRVVNAQACVIDALYVAGFETGLLLFGQGQGVAYCTINVGHLYNNKQNFVADADPTGWANSNTVLGGRFSHSSAEGTAVSGTRHINLKDTTNKVNNNSFLNCSIESPNIVEAQVECCGLYNVWYACRWEANVGTPKVIWGASSRYNQIMYGYDSLSIVETHVAGAGYNTVIHPRGGYLPASGNGYIFENLGSSASPVIVVMQAGARTAGADPATAWTQRITANTFEAKAPGDSFARIKIDTLNGRLYIGNGTVSPVPYIYGTASNIMIQGPVSFNPDNTHDFGASGVRPKRVIAGTSLNAGVFTVRPTASSVGKGGHIWDDNLGKPIWSTGSVWVDATGATV